MYFVALTEKDTENIGIRTRLLELYNGAGGLKVPIQSDRAWLPSVSTKECLTGVPQRVDFTRVEDFLPLYVTGDEFASCPSVQSVKEVVKTIAIEPINTWFAELGAAQQTTVDNSGKAAAEPVVVGGPVITGRITRVLQAGGFGGGEAVPLRTISEGNLADENV
jgi:hypothetical protein